jgi:hypothetical protein
MNTIRDLRRFALLLSLALMFHARAFAGLSAHSALWPECDTSCDSSSCTDSCYADEIAFENGDSISCLDWGSWDASQSCCGDGICDMSLDGNGDPSDNNEFGNCYADCHNEPGDPLDCNPNTQEGCSSGQACAPNWVCVNIPDYSGGSGNNGHMVDPSCTTNYCDAQTHCCAGDACYLPIAGWGGSGICVPQVAVPPAAPSPHQR